MLYILHTCGEKKFNWPYISLGKMTVTTDQMA